MLKILIADDVEIVRRGIKEILNEGYPTAFIDEASDYSALISKATNEEWDLIITDITMPGGTETIRTLVKKFPASPILVMSVNSEEEYVVSVLNAGASGFLNKDATPPALMKAVDQILFGKNIFQN